MLDESTVTVSKTDITSHGWVCVFAMVTVQCLTRHNRRGNRRSREGNASSRLLYVIWRFACYCCCAFSAASYQGAKGSCVSIAFLNYKDIKRT